MNKYYPVIEGYEYFDYDCCYPCLIFNACRTCKYRYQELPEPDEYTCEVYPDGIPPEIWSSRKYNEGPCK